MARPAPRLLLAAAFGGGLAVGLATGLLLGSNRSRPAPPADPPPAARARPDRVFERAVLDDRVEGLHAGHGHGSHDVDASRTRAPLVGGGEAIVDPERYPPGSFDRLLADFMAQLDEEAIGTEAFAALLSRDPGLRAEALARLRAETDPGALEALSALLGRVRHPEVEAAAVELALHGARDLKVAALDILDAFETPAAVPAVLPLLDRRDPDLAARAVFALPGADGFSAEEAAPVRAALGELAARGPAAEVRRRALIALASWGGPAAEPDLLRALAEDPDAVARAGAAFALESLRPRSAAALAALARAVANRSEDRQVRENAYQALRRAGPLPPDLSRVMRAYEAEREGLGF